ncbi:MAG: hypothetical protein EZS28_032689 [Streblomastix strix]|uniref:Uncharacterized protein n=1 Tax=Streblomastix strix TaxID=222440 RepID=A0A5J4UPU4_9EUKA|nr:MAG: hypothetical protein EZS28_032689 [Streblomastix strix]
MNVVTVIIIKKIQMKEMWEMVGKKSKMETMIILLKEKNEKMMKMKKKELMMILMKVEVEFVIKVLQVYCVIRQKQKIVLKEQIKEKVKIWQNSVMTLEKYEKQEKEVKQIKDEQHQLLD